MRFSFKDLIAGDPTVKSDRGSDTRFRSYDFLNFLHIKLNAYDKVMRACALLLSTVPESDETPFFRNLSDCCFEQKSNRLLTRGNLFF